MVSICKGDGTEILNRHFSVRLIQSLKAGHCIGVFIYIPRLS